MKQLSTLTLLLFLCTFTVAQSVWENPINDGTINSTNNPYMTGDVVVEGVAVSGIGASSGISVVTSSNRFNASTWATTFETGDYFTFTLTPDAGQFIHFENFNFSYQKSQMGPTNYSLRSSADNFTSDIADGALLSSGSFTTALSSSTFRNVSTAIEFRLYAWGSTSTSGTFSVNDFAFNGTVSNTTLPISFGAVHAREKEGRLNVQWTTFKETNNDRFEVELSYNGTDFKTVKIVQSKNSNSEIPLHYDISISLKEITVGLLGLPFLFIFSVLRLRRRMPLLLLTLVIVSAGIGACTKNNIDLKEAAGKQLFIRIKQVDIDGTQTYSKVIKVIRS